MSRRFDKTLENATDLTLVEPNWEGILECVDMIRGSDVAVKPALQAIQKRYHNENPHVAHHALLVLEACVKNCGKRFHTEIATKDFMDDMKNLVIEGAPEKVKTKILELIQCWASAFENMPQYKIVCDTHSFLKMYGFEFPALKEANAMFMANQAPEWADGDSCFRCRVEFGVFTRKHHCRSCGQIFCDRCSARQMLLPHFGIEKKVRVCETCFTKSNDADTKKLVEKITQNGQRGGDPTSADEEKRQRELKEKEEEEFQLALALSLSESESKDKSRQSGIYQQLNSINFDSTPSNGQTEPTKANGSDYSYIYRGVATESSAPTGSGDYEDDIDPALSRYLDKRYWEQRQAAREAETANVAPGVRATAPPPSEMSFSTSSGDPTVNDYASYAMQNNGTQQPSVSAVSNGNSVYSVPVVEQKMAALGIESNDEIEQTIAFCKNLREQVEVMDNRMRSNMLRGRSVINDSAIHSLFNQLTKKHGEVLTRMTNLEKDREYYERLQDHLGYIQEARKALIELREENAKKRQERLREEKRLQAQQMQFKLEQVRRQKYERLMEQRNAAYQLFQEEEMRIHQNRSQTPQGPVPQQFVQGVQPYQMPPPGTSMAPGHEQIPQASFAMPQPMAPHIPQQVPSMQHYQIPQSHPQMQYQQPIPPQQSVPHQMPMSAPHQMPPQQHYPSQPVSQPQAYMHPGQHPSSQYPPYAQINHPDIQQPPQLPQNQANVPPDVTPPNPPGENRKDPPSDKDDDKPLIDFD